MGSAGQGNRAVTILTDLWLKKLLGTLWTRQVWGNTSLTKLPGILSRQICLKTVTMFERSRNFRDAKDFKKTDLFTCS